MLLGRISGLVTTGCPRKGHPSRVIQSHRVRISQPALFLVRQHNLDLSHLPGDIFITEKMVRELITSSTKPKLVLPDQPYDPNAIIVYGAGGHGKALIDLIRMLGIILHRGYRG